MSELGWERYTPHALVATIVFEYMHIADELAGNWAPFEPFNDPMVATFMMGGFTFFALWALWWVLRDNPWGYGLAALFGLFFLLAEMWHWVAPVPMTTFQWSIVILAQASAATVVILGTIGLRKHRPWTSASTDG